MSGDDAGAGGSLAASLAGIPPSGPAASSIMVHMPGSLLAMRLELASVRRGQSSAGRSGRGAGKDLETRIDH